MKHFKTTLVMAIFWMAMCNSLHAGTIEEEESILNKINATLFEAVTSYQRLDFSKSYISSKIVELNGLVVQARAYILELNADDSVNKEMVASYSKELETYDTRLKRLTNVHSKTLVNTLYSPDNFKKNLLELERKDIFTEFTNRGFLNQDGKIPKHLNGYIIFDDLENAADILAEKLIANGLTLSVGGLPSLVEYEMFSELDERNRTARSALVQKAEEKDVNATRAVVRVARRSLQAGTLIAYILYPMVFTDATASSFSSSIHGYGYVGVGIVLAIGTLEALDGYWALKGKRQSIARIIPARIAKTKEKGRILAKAFVEGYKSFKISSDKKLAKKQVDNVVFSLLFAEMIGGGLYQQAIENALVAIKDDSSPVSVDKKPVMEMMIRRHDVYSAEEILNEYMASSNDPKDWPVNIRDASIKAKERAMEWYIALCLLEKSKSTPMVEKVRQLATKFPADLKAVVLNELAKTSEMPVEEKISLLVNELGVRKSTEEINSGFARIESILHSNGIVGGKINKIEQVIDHLKATGIISEKYSLSLKNNISEKGSIKSSFADVLLEIKQGTLLYFSKLEEIQNSGNISSFELRAKIQELIKLGYMSDEQEKTVLEVVNRPIYNIDTDNIFAATTMSYDSSIPIRIAETSVEEKKNENTKKSDNTVEVRLYQGVEGIEALLSDCAYNNWDIAVAYEKYPYLFSKENLTAYLRSAEFKDKSKALNILTQITLIIDSLEEVRPELRFLRTDVKEMESILARNDVGLLKGRLENILNKKLAVAGPEEVLSIATEFMLRRNGDMDATSSTLITTMVFGTLERNRDDGLLSLLQKLIKTMGDESEIRKKLEQKLALLSLLVICKNENILIDINGDVQLVNIEYFLINFVGVENVICSLIMNNVQNMLSVPEYKVTLNISDLEKVKAFDMVEKINRVRALNK